MSITLDAPSPIDTLEPISLAPAAATAQCNEPCQASYALLRGLIMDAKLLPNTHHLESLVASELGLSLAAVRDSARQLEAEGLVISEGRGGFWVTPISASEMFDLFGELGGLEARAAYLTAKTKPGSIEVHALHDAISTMETALYQGNLNRIAQACHHFHRSFVQACGDSATIAEALALSDQMHRARMLRLRLEALPYGIVQDYMDVVQAIAAGNADLAHQIHRDHWLRAADSFGQLIARHNMGSISA